MEALVKGVQGGDRPGYLIHLSGTAGIADFQDATYLGKKNPKVWSGEPSIFASALSIAENRR